MVLRRGDPFLQVFLKIHHHLQFAKIRPHLRDETDSHERLNHLIIVNALFLVALLNQHHMHHLQEGCPLPCHASCSSYLSYTITDHLHYGSDLESLTETRLHRNHQELAVIVTLHLRSEVIQLTLYKLVHLFYEEDVDDTIMRSEERRVGKEYRYRWSRYQYKEKNAIWREGGGGWRE